MVCLWHDGHVGWIGRLAGRLFEGLFQVCYLPFIVLCLQAEANLFALQVEASYLSSLLSSQRVFRLKEAASAVSTPEWKSDRTVSSMI